METTAKKLEKLPDSTTLGEIRAFLRKEWEKGCECPSCGQRVQRYSRPITSAMAYALILFFQRYLANKRQNNSETWIHAETFLKNSDCPSSIRGDFSKLKYWGLIQPAEESEGFYMITEKGIQFVLGNVKVESNVLIYNNKFLGFKGDYKDIKECLKTKFNYELLMKGVL
jgi:hypothetical protein